MDELSMVEQLIELAEKSMKIKDNICQKPTTRSSQHNLKKGDRLFPEQAKHSFTDQALLSRMKKELDAFIMMDGKVSKFLQYTSKTFSGTIKWSSPPYLTDSMEPPIATVSPSTKTPEASSATEIETNTQPDKDTTPQSFLDDETKENKDTLFGILKEVLSHLTDETSRAVEIDDW
jgi:hypothetical protein